MLQKSKDLQRTYVPTLLTDDVNEVEAHCLSIPGGIFLS